MVRLLGLLPFLFARVFCSRRDLLLENLALRQQLGVLKQRHRRPQWAAPDKFFWVMLRRLWPGWKGALILVQPETVVRWHRAGFSCIGPGSRGVRPMREETASAENYANSFSALFLKTRRGVPRAFIGELKYAARQSLFRTLPMPAPTGTAPAPSSSRSRAKSTECLILAQALKKNRQWIFKTKDFITTLVPDVGARSPASTSATSPRDRRRIRRKRRPHDCRPNSRRPCTLRRRRHTRHRPECLPPQRRGPVTVDSGCQLSSSQNNRGSPL